MNSSGSTSSTILLVEDDGQVRALIRTLLSAQGFRILEAQTGLQGLEMADTQDAQVDLLLSDMLLPELSGYDLALRLREKNPALQVLFMSGYVEGDIVQKCTQELRAGFIDKPFLPHVLLTRVHELLQPGKNG